MAIESVFHKDLSKFEPTYKGGMTKRQLKMVFQSLPGIALMIVEVFFLEGFSLILFASLTALLLIAPPVLAGIDKGRMLKTDLDFALKKQERYYTLEKMRRYEKNEFVSNDQAIEYTKFRS